MRSSCRGRGSVTDYEERKQMIAGTKLLSVYEYAEEYLVGPNIYHEFTAMREDWEFTFFGRIGERRFRADVSFPADALEEDGHFTPAGELTDAEKLVISTAILDGINWHLNRRR